MLIFVKFVQIQETNDRLVDEQDKFYKIQVQDEVQMLEKIDILVGNVQSISLQSDLNKIHEIAVDVKRIWKAMMDCRETGLLFNQRQKLFGMKVVPYDDLNKLIRDFEPYRSLWVTASGKQRRVKPWSNLNYWLSRSPILYNILFQYNPMKFQ